MPTLTGLPTVPWISARLLLFVAHTQMTCRVALSPTRRLKPTPPWFPTVNLLLLLVLPQPVTLMPMSKLLLLHVMVVSLFPPCLSAPAPLQLVNPVSSCVT